MDQYSGDEGKGQTAAEDTLGKKGRGVEHLVNTGDRIIGTQCMIAAKSINKIR